MTPTLGTRTDWLSLADEPAGHHARLLDAIRLGSLAMTALGGTSLMTAYSRRDAVQILTGEARFSADVVALRYFPVFGRQPLMSDDGQWRRTVRAELARHIRAARLDRARVREIVAGVLDELTPGQEHDLFTAVAGEISARVFAKLLGVPDDIGAAIATHAAEVARFGLSPLAGMRAARRLRACLVSAMSGGAGKVTSGLLGSLTRYVADQSISAGRLLDSLLMLTLAGTETTTAAISTMLYALLGPGPVETAQHEARSAQRAVGASAAAETLRWEPPVQMTCRRVTTDCVINNTQLRKDSLVLIHLGAASLDGDGAGSDPARFSLARPSRPPTLAFGSGPHRCPRRAARVVGARGHGRRGPAQVPTHRADSAAGRPRQRLDAQDRRAAEGPAHVTADDLPDTLAAGLSYVERRWPARVALAGDDGSLSFGDLAAACRGVRSLLAGIGPQSHIAVMLENGLSFGVIAFAVMSAGHVLAPADPRADAGEVSRYLAEIKPRLIFARPGTHPTRLRAEAFAQRSGARIVDVDARSPAAWVRRGRSCQRAGCADGIAAGDVAAIFRTSGTTGAPAAVLHTHGSLCAAANALRQQYRLYLGGSPAAFLKRTASLALRYRRRLLPAALGREVWMTPISFHTIAGFSILSQCILTGRTLVTVSRFYPRSALRLIAGYRVTTMALTPTLADLMIRLQDFSSYDVSSLLVVGLGGSLASPSLIARVQAAFGCAVAVGYGSTELGGGVLSTGLIGPADAQVPAAGRPFPGVQVQVLDEEHRPAGTGAEVNSRARRPASWRATWATSHAVSVRTAGTLPATPRSWTPRAGCASWAGKMTSSSGLAKRSIRPRSRIA